MHNYTILLQITQRIIDVLVQLQTRKHSSMMRIASLPTVRASVATRYQYTWGRGPQVNNFEQVSSDGHHLSLVGGGTVQ